jgi:hypothetical protein
MPVLFPRLDAHHASAQLMNLTQADPQELRKEINEPLAQVGETYGATGGTPMRHQELVRLQNEIRVVARQHGFPAQLTREKAAQWDQRTAVLLYERMGVTPHEASQPGVWQYLCCCAVPDVVRWRFPGKDDKGTNADRFMGGRRNALGRLWWRAFVLKDPHVPSEESHNLLRSLGEDELVQLMERPAVFGNRRLVQAAARTFLAEAGKGGVVRQTLMREMQRRLVRRLPLFFLAGVDDQTLKDAMQDIATASRNAITSE